MATFTLTQPIVKSARWLEGCNSFQSFQNGHHLIVNPPPTHLQGTGRALGKRLSETVNGSLTHSVKKPVLEGAIAFRKAVA